MEAAVECLFNNFLGAKEFLLYKISAAEMDWRLQTNSYKCVTNCVLRQLMVEKTTTATTAAPAFIERVFIPSKSLIDCSNGVKLILLFAP
jgi:hypothetical protein